MAANSKLKLPGDFQAGKKYLLDGGTLLAWRKALEQDRIVPGKGLKESQAGAGGRVLTVTVEGGGGISSNAFWRTYSDDDFHYLQGGQVTGWDTPVADIVLGDVGSEPADGSVHWLEVTGDGTKIEGVLYGGFKPTGVDDTTATSPTSTVPTVDSHTGRKFYLLLGSWLNGVFTPYSAGNLTIGFCGSAYSPTRF
jgi:hypothetical protein